MTDILFIAAVGVAILLGWTLYRDAGRRGIASVEAARRATSRLVGSGQLVVGTRRRAVTLALTDSTLFYESSRMQASIDLESALAIEYDTALAAGADVTDGRVLRLRSTSGTVEFVLPREDVTNWYMNLPPRPEKALAAVTTPVGAPPTAPVVWLR